MTSCGSTRISDHYPVVAIWVVACEAFDCSSKEACKKSFFCSLISMSNQRVCVFARSPPPPANSLAIGPCLSRDNHLKKQQQQHIVYILFSPQSAENVPLYSSNSIAYVSLKLLAAFCYGGANLQNGHFISQARNAGEV